MLRIFNTSYYSIILYIKTQCFSITAFYALIIGSKYPHGFPQGHLLPIYVISNFYFTFLLHADLLACKDISLGEKLRVENLQFQ